MSKAEAVVLVSTLSAVNLVFYLTLGLKLNLLACGAAFIALAIILSQ